jgi:hypothetical protein
MAALVPAVAAIAVDTAIAVDDDAIPGRRLQEFQFEYASTAASIHGGNATLINITILPIQEFSDSKAQFFSAIYAYFIYLVLIIMFVLAASGVLCNSRSENEGAWLTEINRMDARVHPQTSNSVRVCRSHGLSASARAALLVATGTVKCRQNIGQGSGSGNARSQYFASCKKPKEGHHWRTVGWTSTRRRTSDTRRRPRVRYTFERDVARLDVFVSVPPGCMVRFG